MVLIWYWCAKEVCCQSEQEYFFYCFYITLSHLMNLLMYSVLFLSLSLLFHLLSLVRFNFHFLVSSSSWLEMFFFTVSTLRVECSDCQQTLFIEGVVNHLLCLCEKLVMVEIQDTDNYKASLRVHTKIILLMPQQLQMTQPRDTNVS